MGVKRNVEVERVGGREADIRENHY